MIEKVGRPAHGFLDMRDGKWRIQGSKRLRISKLISSSLELSLELGGCVHDGAFPLSLLHD